MTHTEFASWFQISWIDEAWSTEELRKAVEIQTAIAWWLGQNQPGSPMPDWCYLDNPISKADLLDNWDCWKNSLNEEKQNTTE